MRLLLRAFVLALACAATAAAQSGRVRRPEPAAQPSPEQRAGQDESARQGGDQSAADADDDAEPERDEAGDRVYRGRQVDRKVQLLSRPAPADAHRARRHDVRGEVVLRVVLAASGKVEKIVVVKGLPHGVTEAAIKAARGIRFVPAERDGRKVSQWVTIHYNFNLY